VFFHAGEDGEDEGGGFAGACLGGADDVASFEDRGDGAGLDGGGVDVAHADDGFDCGFAESELGEGVICWNIRFRGVMCHPVVGGLEIFVGGFGFFV